MAQEQPRGATLRLRSGEAAERSYPASEVIGGWEQLPRIQDQGRQPGGDAPCPRSGRRPRGATSRPRSLAVGRSYPASEVRGGGREETPHVRGQGQAGEVISHPRPGVVTLRSHPEPEARGGSWEEPPTPEARASGQEEHPEEQCLRRRRRA